MDPVWIPSIRIGPRPRSNAFVEAFDRPSSIYVLTDMTQTFPFPVLRFRVESLNGIMPYEGGQLLLPMSSVFNPRARLVEAACSSALSMSCVQAVCKHDAGAHGAAGSTRAHAAKRIVYSGPSAMYEGVQFDSGISLWEIRNRRKSLELHHLRDVHDHVISVALAATAALAMAVFKAAAISASRTAGSTAAVFCAMLHDTYAEASLSAVSQGDAHVLHVETNIAITKQAIASRILAHFAFSAETRAAAATANIPTKDTDVVVLACCFDVVERGLRDNALTRGHPVGPECPVCYEDIDTTSETSPHSLIILECTIPRDYAHGAIHHLCRGCWSSMSRQAVEKGTRPRCPNCRETTVGRTVSQCAYGVMTELII